MSEVLAQLEKKGGELSETTLWTNSSPSSSFSGRTITLPQRYTNFDKLRIYYRISTIADHIYFIDIDKTNWNDMVDGGNMPKAMIGCSSADASTNVIRQFRRTTDTNVIISNATYYISSIDNNYLLPQKICGLK